MSPYCFPGMSASDRRELIIATHKESETYINGRFKAILKAIERATGYNLQDLKSDSRKEPIPFLRALVSTHLFKQGFANFTRIGVLMGKHHTTILYQVKKIYPNLKNDLKYQLILNEIHKYL